VSFLATQRKEKILAFLEEDGYAKVAQLSKLFHVTEVTIRQDLLKLEDEGLVVREHGGASLKALRNRPDSIPVFNQQHMAEKKAIAKKTLEFIEDGDGIILDAGSTTTEIAKALKGKRRVKVVTNALNIAMILGADSGIETIVTGGEYKPPTLSLTGHKAADFFKGLHVDKLFLATAGISPTNGLTYPSINDIDVKKAMITTAKQVFLVADSSKINKMAFASLGSLELMDYWITDAHIDPIHEAEMAKNGIQVIKAA